MADLSTGHLLNFFRELISTEQTANAVKQDLLCLSSGKSHLLLRLISGNEEQIDINSLKHFVSPHLAVNNRQLYEVLERMDHHRKGYISRDDFKAEIENCGLPKYKKRREWTKQTHDKRLKDTMDQCFLRLLSVWVRSCRVLDIWRNQLAGVRPYLLFDDINTSKTGIISQRELFQFFYRHSQQLNSKDCQFLHSALLRRFHTKLTLEVFCQNLQPLEFGYYPAFKYNFEERIAMQMREKEQLTKEMAEVQENEVRAHRNRVVVKEIKKESVLRRESELQKRIQAELRAYQEMKFLTKKKYHPDLSYDQFVLLEKEKEDVNLLNIKKAAEEAKIKQQLYKEKIRSLEVMRRVQQLQTRNHSQKMAADSAPRKTVLQVETHTKNHALSVQEQQPLLIKNQIHRKLGRE